MDSCRETRTVGKEKEENVRQNERVVPRSSHRCGSPWQRMRGVESGAGTGWLSAAGEGWAGAGWHLTFAFPVTSVVSSVKRAGFRRRCFSPTTNLSPHSPNTLAPVKSGSRGGNLPRAASEQQPRPWALKSPGPLPASHLAVFWSLRPKPLGVNRSPNFSLCSQRVAQDLTSHRAKSGLSQVTSQQKAPPCAQGRNGANQS